MKRAGYKFHVKSTYEKFSRKFSKMKIVIFPNGVIIDLFSLFAKLSMLQQFIIFTVFKIGR